MEPSLKGLDFLANLAIILGAGAFVLGLAQSFWGGFQLLVIFTSFALPMLISGITLKVTVVALQLYSKHVAAYTRIAAVLDRNLDIWARNTK